MSGIKKSTNDLLFNGITMKVAIDAGYTLNDLNIVIGIHNKLVAKYNTMSPKERAGLRSQAQKYLDGRMAELEKKQEEARNAKANEGTHDESITDSGISESTTTDATSEGSTEVSNP